MQKIVTGTINQKMNILWDKRLQKTFYSYLNQKRLRTTALNSKTYDRMKWASHSIIIISISNYKPLTQETPFTKAAKQYSCSSLYDKPRYVQIIFTRIQ